MLNYISTYCIYTSTMCLICCLNELYCFVLTAVYFVFYFVSIVHSGAISQPSFDSDLIQHPP